MYSIKSGALMFLICLVRLLNLLVFLSIASIVAYFLIKKILINTQITDDDNIKAFLQVLEYGTISTFAVFLFKNVITSNSDRLINYVFINDIDEDEILESNWSFSSKKDRYEAVKKYVQSEIQYRILFRISIYFVIIVLAGWLAIETYKEILGSDKVTNHNKPNNYYFYMNSSLSDSAVWREHSSDFKLIFSFGHNEKDIESFNKDERETLYNLLVSLKGCLQTSTDIVELSIIGFASENQDKEEDKLKDINLANDRANIVCKLIEDYKKKNISLNPYLEKIKVNVHEWKPNDYSKMVEARIFKEEILKDITNEQRRKETAEYLNRRAEVLITNAGGCN